MYRCLIPVGVSLLLSGCCQFDDDCLQRQSTENQLDEVRAGKRYTLMEPHPELLRDFASEKSAEKIDTIWFTRNVSSPDFAALASFPNLKHVELYDTRCTDDLLKHLATAKNVEIIDTDSTDISDAGLASVAQMPALEKFIIFETSGEITVEGIKKLNSVKTLKTLDPGILLSAEEKEEIQEVMPDVTLQSDFQ